MPEKPTILVVDDDQPIVTLMRKLLVEFGFDAVTASNPNSLSSFRISVTIGTSSSTTRMVGLSGIAGALKHDHSA